MWTYSSGWGDMGTVGMRTTGSPDVGVICAEDVAWFCRNASRLDFFLFEAGVGNDFAFDFTSCFWGLGVVGEGSRIVC